MRNLCIFRDTDDKWRMRMAIDLNRGGHGCTKTSGLTLVELMVVIAMTGILTAMMLPALSTAKEKSRRAVCKNNERQIIDLLQIISGKRNFFQVARTTRAGTD